MTFYSCGNVGKVSRITSAVDSSFKTIAGFIDFLLPAVSVGSAGAISPLPNIAPVSDFLYQTLYKRIKIRYRGSLSSSGEQHNPSITLPACRMPSNFKRKPPRLKQIF